MGSSSTDTITNAIITGDHMKNLLKYCGQAIQVIYSLVTLAAMVGFIINIAKLATSSGNPAGRSQAMWNILISGICLSVLGGLGIIYAVFVSLAAGG